MIQTDLICGNNKGDISIVSFETFMQIKEKAHNDCIICIKIFELRQSKTFVITSAEDEMIKIWDASFNLIK